MVCDPVTVEVIGCDDVVPGPTCLITARTALSIWIPAMGAVTVSPKGAVRSSTVVPDIDFGTRVELTVVGTTPQVQLRVATERKCAVATVALGVTPSAADPGAAATSARHRIGALESVRRAREARGTGDHETAAQHYAAAMNAAAAGSFWLTESQVAGALAFYLIRHARDFGEARTVLDRPVFSRPIPQVRAYGDYYSGLLATETGDARTALRRLQRGQAIAHRTGDRGIEMALANEHAVVLASLGRWSEALDIVEGLLAAPDLSNPCMRAALLSNKAWYTLLGRRDMAVIGPTLDEALRLYDPPEAGATSADGTELGCKDAVETASGYVTYALFKLEVGQVDAAAEHLASARRANAAPDRYIAQWTLDALGRIALARGESGEAIAAYERLDRLGRSSASTSATWVAAVGLAGAERARGRFAQARAAYERAETLSDEMSGEVPLGEGRDTFLSLHARATAEFVDLLLTSNDAQSALRVARRARARLIATLQRTDRLGSLSPDKRAAWDRAIAVYRKKREALDTSAKDDWTLPADQLDKAAEARRTEERALRAALDEALLLLKDDAASDHHATLPPPGTALVVFHPLPRGWVGFAADDKRVVFHRYASAEQTRSLAPLSDVLSGAKRVRIMAASELAHVDFAALAYGDGLLLDHAAVEYALDLRTSTTAATRVDSVLIVADPNGNLPNARVEAAAVRERVKRLKPTVLDGPAATSDAVRAAIARADLFHYAGHGEFGGLDGLDSALPLASGGKLTVGDILALPATPRIVMLSGCETAKANQVGTATSLGLAHAFLAAGSHVVIAAVRPVRDADAAAISAALYRNDFARDPAEALRKAQLELRKRDPKADWSALRALVR